MKKIISVLLLFSLLLCGCQKKEQDDPVSIGEPILSSFSATDINGNAVDQQILSHHKLTMINVWATFCPPCIQEMPDLGELNGAYGNDFQIIGIVIDATDRNLQAIPEEIAEAREIINTTGANYLHILPSSSLNKAFLAGISSVPTTIFLDKNGNQIGEVYIGSRTKAQWQEIIENLLKQL